MQADTRLKLTEIMGNWQGYKSLCDQDILTDSLQYDSKTPTVNPALSIMQPYHITV